MAIRFPFRIRYKPRKSYGVNIVSGFNDLNQLGECDQSTKQIKIKESLSDKKKASVLTHEVIHLICLENDLGLTEPQVESLEVCFMRILELNQDYLKLIYETHRKTNRGSK